MAKLVSIPASVLVYIDGDTDEETLVDSVIGQHGKYITLHINDLGFDNAVVLDDNA